MALLPRLWSPFLLRRLLSELRGIRRALERQADLAELQILGAPQPGRARTFRGLSHDAPDTPDQSAVSYVREDELSRLLGEEHKLRELLGRDPTDEELERAFRGDVE